mgnify:CR=1 FL=1
MKRINILLTALALIFATSCDSFLDVKPSNQADAESSIQNASDAKIMLQGLMNKLTSSSYYGRNFLIYGDAKGGDLTTYSAGNGGDAWYYFTHEQTSNSYSGYWSTMYNCLLQANNIIKNINLLKEAGVTGLDDYLGQALTVRALIHFDLVRLYGKPYNMDKGAGLGVPVVTEIVNASEQRTRNTVAEVYTQIVNDLLAGADLISKDKSNGYINYYGNQALLAKVYLYMENWSAAQTAAENVINSGVYEPGSSYWMTAMLASDECYGGGGQDDYDVQASDHLLVTEENVHSDYWNAYYSGIARANMAIANLDKVEDEAMRNQLLGEAYFLRSFFLFDLTQLCGEIPLVSSVPSSVSDAAQYPEQASIEEIYGTIAAGLKQAIEIMPSNRWDACISGLRHATKWDAEALLARVYLFYTGFYSDKNGESAGGFIAVHMMNTLSTGGLSIQSSKSDKGRFAFEFMAHYSMAVPDTVPFEVYVKAGAEEV